MGLPISRATLDRELRRRKAMRANFARATREHLERLTAEYALSEEEADEIRNAAEGVIEQAEKRDADEFGEPEPFL